MTEYLYIVIPLVSWAVLGYSFNKDRSRYRNCLYLFIAIASTLLSLTLIMDGNLMGVGLFLLFVLFAVLIAVPFILIGNGITMMKREGCSLANMLSLVFGIVIGTGEIATFIAVGGHVFGGRYALIERHMYDIGMVSMVIGISVIYLSVSFVIFMLYSLFLQIIPRKKDFDYVIIHGAGLLDGERVSKLLADRIDKAIEVYRRDPTPPILIPSGGKGPDEKISEAEAMAAYMIEKGIPEEMIIKEDQSATTYENLANSKAIIDSREGDRYTALVTSNYHVYRALRYCRKVGLKCTGIGSRVAPYYWPSALIREYIAVHAEKKHLIILTAGWLICVVPVIMLYLG